MPVVELSAEHVRIERRVIVGHVVAVDVVGDAVWAGSPVADVAVFASLDRVTKSLANRGEAHRFSRLVRSPRVLRTIGLRSQVAVGVATVVLARRAAGRADRSLTPCQLTLRPVALAFTDRLQGAVEHRSW